MATTQNQNQNQNQNNSDIDSDIIMRNVHQKFPALK